MIKSLFAKLLKVLPAILVLSLVFGLVGTSAFAAQARPNSVNLPANCVLIDTALSGETYYKCPPAASTATSTAVVATNTPTVAPSETPTVAPSATVSATVTPFPGALSGPNGAYENGDLPPAWVQNSAFPASLNWAFNTPGENYSAIKHGGFKGFAGTLNGENVYVIIHLDTNPGGHASRFHSAQVWIQDPTGAVSYFPQWLEFGPDNLTQTGPNIARSGCNDTGVRPVMIVNVQSCGAGTTATPTPLVFETWYSRAAGHLGQAPWYVDLGISVNANYYHFGSPTDPSTWVPTGHLNLTRRLEVSFYANRSNLRGSFWTTQFGRIVSGPSDPACGKPYIVGTRTYTVLCANAYIAPSVQSIQFPGNAFQKDWPGPVVLPN